MTTLCCGLAAANGANDVSKGVATLAGAGVTRYRAAIAWGVAWTLLGSLLSLTFAGRVSTLFTNGIVSMPPSGTLALAALGGAVAWVAVATAARLPVSTTHAIIGGLLGAGLVLSPSAVEWRSLSIAVVTPLLASIAAAYALSTLISRIFWRAPRCVCTEMEVDGRGAIVAAGLGPPVPAMSARYVRVIGDVRERCPAHILPTRRLVVTLDRAHWMTSAATSFARGLNDTPKMWAVAAFALVPTRMSATGLLVLIAAAIAVGGSAAGARIARRLGDDVVRMDHGEGFSANLVTAGLVGLGAHFGLPMSTTHVATGSIAGSAGGAVRRIDLRSVRGFVIAWTATPLVAGLAAAAVASTIR